MNLKSSGGSTAFEPMTSAMPVRGSYLHLISNTALHITLTAFSLNHEMIIPILTELCVHTVGNYIYGTETPFPCENYRYVCRKLKYLFLVGLLLVYFFANVRHMSKLKQQACPQDSDLNKDTKYFRPTQFVKKPAFVYAGNHDSVNKRL